MPVTLVPYKATEAKSPSTMNGWMLLPNGVFYDQYGATTAIANTTTATSLFNDSSTTAVDLGIAPCDSSLLIRANTLTKGTLIRGILRGSIANTGTPDLTVTAGLTTTAGVYTALATTGAITMTTISASFFEVRFEFMVAAVGTSGSIVGTINRTYATTVSNSVPTAATVDTTVDYTIAAQLTWSAASSSNTATITYATVEVVG